MAPEACQKLFSDDDFLQQETFFCERNSATWQVSADEMACIRA